MNELFSTFEIKGKIRITCVFLTYVQGSCAFT